MSLAWVTELAPSSPSAAARVAVELAMGVPLPPLVNNRKELPLREPLPTLLLRGVGGNAPRPVTPGVAWTPARAEESLGMAQRRTEYSPPCRSASRDAIRRAFADRETVAPRACARFDAAVPDRDAKCGASQQYGWSHARALAYEARTTSG
jgi:hypothetical protein